MLINVSNVLKTESLHQNVHANLISSKMNIKFVLNALKNAKNVLNIQINVQSVPKIEFLEVNLNVHAQNINSKRTEYVIIVQRNANIVNLKRSAMNALLKQEHYHIVNAYLDSLKQVKSIVQNVIQNA